ncbi:hypothetical protein QTH91_12815 [Variovorax dokdonensis]|uniref:Uncharacterized protein n=1 Tax=Variovorax dokdonensis TaxID=344883 RepID=A0ABT7NBV5_9BURK|nr:hypothetical protein [Variovorax dokdonensis]MDM0045370.1 hypothetical protein [Variovorax dokdonensis]
MSAPRPYAFSRLDFVDSDFDPLASHLQDCTNDRSFMRQGPTIRNALILAAGLLALAALLTVL